MDQELATAVFSRWHHGYPVAETSFYKAASVLGINPDDALLEARYYTMLDYDLAKVASGGRLTRDALNLYAAASGGLARDFVKTASTYRVHPQDLIFAKLAERNWVPDLARIKLAMMGAPMEAQQMDPMMGSAAQGGDPAMPGPMPDQAVQQAPEKRFKPSPMAPAQVPPSAGGNLEELARSAMEPSPPSQDMQAGMGVGGSPGTDMGPSTPAPPPPSPEEKLQQVIPDMPPETVSRYAEKLQEVEQQAGIPVEDPNQIQKFVAQMKKQDAKSIDEAIKNIGEAPPLRSLNASGQPQQPMPSKPAAQGASPAPTEGAEKVASAARAIARLYAKG